MFSGSNAIKYFWEWEKSFLRIILWRSINNGQETTYTWSKDDFYITDKKTSKNSPGYPLNTISINKKLGKYFTDLTEEDNLLIKQNEDHVIDFIIKSIQ